MSNTIQIEESTLTENYRNTIPTAVRKLLKLRKGDKVGYIINDDDRVELIRVETSEANDPALERFLQFMANDLRNNPQQLKSFSGHLQKQIKKLVRAIKVDLDTALEPKDE